MIRVVIAEDPLALHQSFYENFYPISLYICNLLNYIHGQK
ncbi:hypothetical protein J6TS7_65610 [Paenibacillus dendritiformis]|nr:hypothetical protein J6TS7_65610 [Paenibacillus dendritiformis]